MAKTLPTAQQMTENWLRGMSGSSEKYKQGIERVNESPTEKAANASQAYLDGVQRGNEKRVAKLRMVSLQDWKSAAINKGAARLASGASASKAKYQAFTGRYLPYLSSVQSQVHSMPRGDFATNMARCYKNAELLHNYRDGV